MAFTEWLRAVLTGVLAGITKWLPLSDTAHLFLWNRIWGESTVFTAGYTMLLSAVAELGAMLALTVVFFHKLNPISQFKTEDQKRNTRALLKKIGITGLPFLVLYAVARLAFGGKTDFIFESPYGVAALLILGGAFLFFTENRIFKKDPDTVKISEIPGSVLWKAGAIALLGLFPGGDTTGLCLAAFLIFGCSRYVSAEMAFYVAIPVTFVRFAVTVARYLIFIREPLNGSMIFGLIATLSAAMLSSFFVIRPFLHYLKRHDVKPFAIYRIVIGLLCLIVFVVS